MSRASVVLKRLGFVGKIALGLFVFAVCAFMLWRIFSMGTPSEIKTVTPNEKLSAAYTAKGDDLYMFKQSYDEINTDKATKGYFAVPEVVFIPEANQVQLVFRYNNSTLKSLAEDKKLSSVPDKNSDLFDVSLCLYTALVPEYEKDNLGNAEITKDDIGKKVGQLRFLPSGKPISERTTLYCFYRYTFDCVSEDGQSLSQLLDEGKLISAQCHIYYNGDKNLEEAPYGAISIYDSRRENKQVMLSKNDKKALEAAK